MPVNPRDVSEENLAGHVYIASNPLMPGLVKVGRTRSSVRSRLKSLYTTGVPGPFREEAARFFVDSFEGEWSIIQLLSSVGTRCQNREFFLVDTGFALSVLDEQYRHQHQRFDEDTFEWKVFFFSFFSFSSSSSSFSLPFLLFFFFQEEEEERREEKKKKRERRK